MLLPFLVSAQNWSLQGRVEGLPEGTWLYLRTAKPQIVLDSAQVKQGQFALKGTLSEKTRQVALHTAQFSEYVLFWLEATPMQVQLKSGAFKQATFSGSVTQQDEDALRTLIDPRREQQDKLRERLSVSKDDKEKSDIRQQIKILEEQERQNYIAFIQSHPQSTVAAHVLSVYASTWGKDKVKPLYEGLSPEMKASEYGRGIQDYIRLVQDIQVGGKYADFEQADAQGKMIRFSDIKAKYILLEFWGSWCGPCRAENPNLVKTYQTYQPKGFEIVGVAADDNKAQWLEAIKTDKLPWINLCDLNGDRNKVVQQYSINAFPTNFLIDQTGTIIAKNLRGDALSKKLAELLR